MAANAGFKQQCPSCEEKVLIKDTKLVGKKIDCPKCKYRFVVEEPDDDADDEVAEEKPGKKKAGAVAAKSGSAKATMKPGKASPAKAKPVKKDDEDDEDEDEDEEAGKFKAKGGKKKAKLIIFMGLAGVAVILLGVAGFFIFSGSGDSGKKNPSRGAGANPGATQQAQSTPTTQETPVAKKAGPDLADPTHHLLGSAEGVLNLNVPEFLRSPLGKIALDNGLTPDWVKEHIGLTLNDFERIVSAGYANDTSIMIVRASAAFPLETLKKTFDLKNADPIRGQEYFTCDAKKLVEYLKSLSPEKPKETTPDDETVAFRLHDPFTLVVGNPSLMKQFLEVEGKPALQAGGSGAPAPAGAPPPGGAVPPPAVGGKSGGQGQQPNPQAGQGAPPPGAPGTQPGAPGGAAEAGNSSAPYQTLQNAGLRAMLERVEAKKPMFSIAFALTKKISALPQLANDFRIAGFSIFMEDGIGATVGVECKSAADAKKMEATVRALLALASNSISTSSKMSVVWAQSADNAAGVPPGQPNPNPAAPNPAIAGAQNPVNPGAAKEETPKNPFGTITIEGPRQLEATVQLIVKLDAEAFGFLQLAFLSPAVHQIKGEMAMKSANPQPHDLANATKAYAGKAKIFPRGTFDRPVPGARQGRPWTPDQRVGWLPELLPFLGYADLQRQIDVHKSWRDPENLNAAMTLVPYFIDPNYPKTARQVRYPGLGLQVAATHFVGIAGVGLDAAEYSDKDDEDAGKRGVFGYDRSTPLSDIGDHTILMVQVPATQIGPWLAGGGATTRGVPLKNSVKPFVSTTYNGKKGTYAIMVDGSVRFIAADVSDEVFKALAAVKKDKDKPIAGLESIPVVPPGEKKSELKAGDPIPATPPVVRPSADSGNKVSDAEIRKLIIGKWYADHKTERVDLKGTDVFKTDGTFSGEATRMEQGKSLTVSVTGTWKVDDGILIETIETCDPPVIKKGTVSKDRVLSITAKEMKLKTEGGREILKIRVGD